MKSRSLLLIALVVIGGTPNAGGRQEPSYRDVAKLLLDDGEARERAKETLVASKDTTLLAPSTMSLFSFTSLGGVRRYAKLQR